MFAFREVCGGTLVIAILVAAGSWLVERPDVVDRNLPAAMQAGRSPDHSISVRRIAWSADGERLLTQTSAAANSHHSLILHHLADPAQKRLLDVEWESVSSLSMAADRRHALVSTYNGRLRWINLESEEQTVLLELQPASALTTAAISADGRWAAAASDDGRVLLCPVPPDSESASADNHRPALDIADGPAWPIVTLARNLGATSCKMRFSDSGDRLLRAGNDGTLHLWDLPSGALLQTFRGSQRIVTAAVFLPDRGRIMSAGLDDTIHVWDVASGGELWSRKIGFQGVNALALSPDGKTAAWGGYGRTIQVWDIDRQILKFEIECPASIIWDLEFSPDGRSLAVAGRENLVRIYDAQTGSERRQLDVRLM